MLGSECDSLRMLSVDKNGTPIVIAFEYDGLTSGELHWAYFVVDLLRDLRRTGDPWPEEPLESRPQFDLTGLEATMDAPPAAARSAR
jgi:hypothetical protein